MPELNARNLTPKQAAFAAAYVELGNAAAAYRRVYRVRPDTQPRTVWDSASKLLRHPRIAQRIEELRAKTAERQEITVESLSERLQRAYDLAMTSGRPNAAVAAAMALAKLHGLLKDRSEVEARNYVVGTTPAGDEVEETDYRPMTPEEWERKYGAAG